MKTVSIAMMAMLLFVDVPAHKANAGAILKAIRDYNAVHPRQK